MAKKTFEFLVFGMGKSTATGSKWKGVRCPEGDCSKGIPPPPEPGKATPFGEDGYEKIQGPKKPTGLGGASFSTLGAARKFLDSKRGDVFKASFENVFLVRVQKD